MSAVLDASTEEINEAIFSDTNVNQRAAYTFSHTHKKSVTQIGLNQYHTYVEKSWYSNGHQVSSTGVSHWYSIVNGNWRFVSKQVTHHANVTPQVHRTNVIFEMRKSVVGGDQYRSTQNTLCGRANGSVSYNFDCS